MLGAPRFITYTAENARAGILARSVQCIFMCHVYGEVWIEKGITDLQDRTLLGPRSSGTLCSSRPRLTAATVRIATGPSA